MQTSSQLSGGTDECRSLSSQLATSISPRMDNRRNNQHRSLYMYANSSTMKTSDLIHNGTSGELHCSRKSLRFTAASSDRKEIVNLCATRAPRSPQGRQSKHDMTVRLRRSARP